MSVFKKRCFACGEQADQLFEGKCEECLVEEMPPIKEVKPITLKIDNQTKQICYNNYYYNQEVFFKMLPDIAKKNLVLNEHYVLKELKIENILVKGHKLEFDIEVDCDLKNE